jgi:hypothetical protein
MNKLRFWIPCLIGVLLTPIFIWAGTLSGKGAASHAGAGFQLFLFYPIPFLVAIFINLRIITVFCIGLAIFQFPFFGFFISYARTKKGSIAFALLNGLICLHVFVSLLALAGVLYSAF